MRRIMLVAMARKLMVALWRYITDGIVPDGAMRRHRGVSLERMIADLNPLLRGWAGYFGFSQLHELSSLDGWTRRRLRCVVWVQWKTRGRRYQELRRLKVPERSARRPSSARRDHGG